MTLAKADERSQTSSLKFCMNKSHSGRISWQIMGISPALHSVFISVQAPLLLSPLSTSLFPLIFRFCFNGKHPDLMGKNDASLWAIALSQQQLVHFFLSPSGLSWTLTYPSPPLIYTLTSSTTLRGRYYNCSVFQIRKLRHRKAWVKLVSIPTQTAWCQFLEHYRGNISENSKVSSSSSFYAFTLVQFMKYALITILCIIVLLRECFTEGTELHGIPFHWRVWCWKILGPILFNT